MHGPRSHPPSSIWDGPSRRRGEGLSAACHIAAVPGRSAAMLLLPFAEDCDQVSWWNAVYFFNEIARVHSRVCAHAHTLCWQHGVRESRSAITPLPSGYPLGCSSASARTTSNGTTPSSRTRCTVPSRLRSQNFLRSSSCDAGIAPSLGPRRPSACSESVRASACSDGVTALGRRPCTARSATGSAGCRSLSSEPTEAVGMRRRHAPSACAVGMRRLRMRMRMRMHRFPRPLRCGSPLLPSLSSSAGGRRMPTASAGSEPLYGARWRRRLHCGRMRCGRSRLSRRPRGSTSRSTYTTRRTRVQGGSGPRMTRRTR